jgi:multiple sugar transport system substrate-binding protein
MLTVAEPATQPTAWVRRVVAAAVSAALAATGLTACGNESAGTITLSWYTQPDSTGTFDKIAATCNAQAAGRWRLATSVLPSTADGQREQIVRRLAAGDRSVDVMNIDPPYTAELANAGWLSEFSDSERDELLENVLESPSRSAIWKDKLVAVPYLANTQLLWYRKSVAQQAGADPTSATFTWDQMIDAAVRTGKTVAEQGKRYEGYMVWVNALIESGGGSIIENNERGRDATVSVNSAAGQEAARIIHKLSTSRAADPALSTSAEEESRATFDGPNGGFMLNWPYVYSAIQGNVKDGSVPQSVLDDLAWARYPRVKAGIPSKPPIGGTNLAISRFSRHRAEAVDAIRCIVSPTMLKVRILRTGNPVANSVVYDDPEVRAQFPMADLMRESINDAGPRPVTPYYGDVATAIQRTWHPQTQVDPNSTPKRSAQLIDDVLHDRRLL